MPPRITAKMPTRVKSIMARSNLRMTSFSMRKARTTTIIGARLETIEIIVSGMNLVTEYYMMFVVVPVKVLKTSEPA